MPLVSLANASIAYGDLPLLDGVAFQVDPGERVAVVGRNGSGKSTLLKVLAGEQALDGGENWRQPGLSVGYVPQEPDFDPEQTVFASVVSGMGDVSRLVAEFHDVSHQIAEQQGSEADLLSRLHDVQSELDARGAWRYAAQAEQVISRFGLDPDQRVGVLSGGQLRRVALARALATSPDLLLLDEPTNHLDIAAISWLEEFLLGLPTAIIFITHDRRFLDRVASRVIELDRGRLASFPGSFSAYRKRKDELLHAESLAEARFDKRLKEEEIWIRKGVEARRTRAVFRVQRLDQLRAARAARREQLGVAKLRLERGGESGELVAELEGVSKAFGSLTVVRDFSCRIIRGDRIGLVGPNGAGKTTLIRLILGELEADSGRIRLGTRLAVAYSDQLRDTLDPAATLAETISPGSEFVEIGGKRQHVIGYLGDFLFSPQRARSPVSSLSGGERNRLLLARLFARPANVLVLDEPTNDLDIESLELLESLLQDYTGTILLVSHDRAFLDNVVTQVIGAEGEGRWCENAGGYDDWVAFQAARAQQAAEQPAGRTVAAAPKGGAERARSRKALSYKEEKELEGLPAAIDKLETEQGSIAAQLGDPALHSERPSDARRLAERLAAIEDQLTKLLERWEELEAKRDA
ncbi:MAG TPA: ATP-binding cassette domain-containing protein [Rhodocyclaceae bacterium]